MLSLATHYLAFLPLVSRVGPDARVLPIVDQIDFSIDSGYTLDLTPTVQSAQLHHGIQAVFVDTSLVPYGNTVLQCFGTGQRIVIPPLHQGYFPLLLTTNSYIFTFINGSNIGASVPIPMQVFFLNVPFVTQLWAVNTVEAGGFGVGGYGTNPYGQ